MAMINHRKGGVMSSRREDDTDNADNADNANDTNDNDNNNNDAHTLTTLYLEWKAAILEQLGEVPVGFEELVSASILQYVERELELRGAQIARLRQDLELLQRTAR